MRRMIRLFLLTTAALLCAACALSPQIVQLDPEIDLVAEAPRGNGRTIALRVIDARADNIVGSRGGVYDTAYIRTAPDLVDKVHAALRRGYETLGFRVVAADAPADIALRVELTDFSYEAGGAELVRGVKTGVSVRGTGTQGGRTVTGDYREGAGRDVLLAPSGDTNERRLNEDLSAVLRRLVADRRLTDG